jgi:hypothetical protein
MKNDALLSIQASCQRALAFALSVFFMVLLASELFASTR